MKTEKEMEEIFQDLMKAERTAQVKRELLMQAILERIK